MNKNGKIEKRSMVPTQKLSKREMEKINETIFVWDEEEGAGEILRNYEKHYNWSLRYLGAASLELGIIISLVILGIMGVISGKALIILVIIFLPTLIWFYIRSTMDHDIAKRELYKLIYQIEKWRVGR